MKRFFLPAILAALTLGLFFYSTVNLQDTSQPLAHSTSESHQKSAPQASVSKFADKTAHRVEGVVIVGQDHQPVSGAAVRLFNKKVSFSVETNDKGLFQFETVPVGIYHIVASQNRWHSAKYMGHFPEIVVEPDTTIIGPIRLTLFESGRYILKLVSAKDHAPVSGVEVEIPSLKKTLVSNSFGTVQLEGPAGVWFLEARHESHMPTRIRAGFYGKDPDPLIVTLAPSGPIHLEITAPDGAPLPGVSATITASRGASISDHFGGIVIPHAPLDQSLNLRLNKPGYRRHSQTISATTPMKDQVIKIQMAKLPAHDFPEARELTIGGQILNSQGIPVYGALVELPRFELTTTTGNDGRFLLDSFKSGGRYFHLVASATGFAASKADLEFGQHEAGHQEIQIILKDELTVSGQVFDQDGYVVPQGRVLAQGKFGEKSIHASIEKDGSFWLGGLSPGADIIIESPGFAPKNIKASTSDKEEAMEIILTRLETFHGQIVDRATGKPLKSFKIELGSGESINFRTEDGAFLLEECIPGSALNLIVSAEHHTTRPFQVSVVEDGVHDTPTILELSRKGLEIGGIVRNTNRRSLSGVYVIAVDQITNEELYNVLSGKKWRYDELRANLFHQITTGEKPPNVELAVTNAYGAYNFRDLPEATPLHLMIFGPGYAPVIERDIQAREKLLSVVLPKNSRITAQFNRESLKDLSGVHLKALEQDQNRNREIVNSSQFSFIDKEADKVEFTGLTPGKYILSAGIYESPGNDRRILAQEYLDLEEGEHRVVNLGFDHGSVSGHAFLDGHPLTGANLYLFKDNNGNRHSETKTDENGWFQFPKTEPGSYLVVYRAEERPGGGNYFLPPQRGFNAVWVEVDQAGLERDFHFRAFGGLVGRLVTQMAGYRLYLEWKCSLSEQDVTNSMYAGGFVRPTSGGHIMVQSLPPGQGRLFAQYGSSRFVIKDDIVIHDFGTVVNLGDLEIPMTGRLVVRLLNPEPTAGSVSLRLYRPGEQKPIIRSIMPTGGDFVIEEVPAGPIEAVFSDDLPGYRLNPNSHFVNIDPGQESEIVVSLETLTSLYFSMEDQVPFLAAKLIHQRTNEEVSIERILKAVPVDNEEVEWVSYEGKAFNLAPGPWFLEVYTADGSAYSISIHLNPNEQGKFVVPTQK